MAQQQMEESLQRFLHTSLPRNVKTDVTTILKDAECQDNTDRYWNRSGKAGGYVEDIPAFKSDLYNGKGISYWNSEPENNRMLVWQETQPIRPGKYRFTAYAAGGTWSNGNVNSGNNGGLYLFINEQSVEITTETFGVYSVEAEIPSNETNITVGLKAGDNNTVTWAILAQTHLEYLGTSDITSTFLKDAACQDGTNRYWERSGSASGYIENIPAFHSEAYNGAGVSYWTGIPETGKNLIWQKTQAVLPGKIQVLCLHRRMCLGKWKPELRIRWRPVSLYQRPRSTSHIRNLRALCRGNRNPHRGDRIDRRPQSRREEHRHLGNSCPDPTGILRQ